MLAKAGVDIGAREAWLLETGSSEILVAVIDTGVVSDQLDLNIFRNALEANGQSGIDDDGNGCTDDIYGCDATDGVGDAMDLVGHGTHVAGTIAGRGNNSTGVVGVAWDATILPIRAFGPNGAGDVAWAITALDYAVRMGAKIINCSWSTTNSNLLAEAVTRVENAGILIVSSAGNNSKNLDTEPNYPVSFQNSNIIGVGAVDPLGRFARLSNYSAQTVDVAAPGMHILSYGLNGPEHRTGTSMAAPHVSGVAALLWSKEPSLTTAQVKERLMRTAKPYGSLRGKVGAGMVNAHYALINQVPPVDLDDPYLWKSSPQLGETPHPYENDWHQEWTFTIPGAKRVAVYFSRFETEFIKDAVTFKDKSGNSYGELSGRLENGVYSPIIEGDTVVVSFTSDGATNRRGFKIDAVAYAE